MAEPINLNKARKARARVEDKTQAAENRIRFGRSKAEKTVSKLEAERARRAHDEAKRED
jgi:predicted secreted protein